MENKKRLIDANYLRNKFIHNCPIEEGGIPLRDFNAHQKILALYPTVDAVEVVHGTWLDWHNNPVLPNLYYRWWKCSECGHQYAFDEAVKRNYFASHYCPNCGAKMDGDGNA